MDHRVPQAVWSALKTSIEQPSLFVPSASALTWEAFGVLPHPPADYKPVYERMKALVAARQADDIGDTILYGEHAPVFTTGRNTDANHLPRHLPLSGCEIPIVPIERGGSITYHGPGQAVMYPILKLNNGQRDLHAYLRWLEEVCITALAALGQQSHRYKKDDTNTTGVWVTKNDNPPQKIASVGVAVSRWVTYHGLALNVACDLSPNQLIFPCGFGAEVMTTIALQ
ncbi:MAG: lipoyl(octanoyl) transferase LipB [Vampirovibrionales bacterium]|nr:lipoyl(octanoyl) transferase LipB [Vampirovibrionales bacterium]